MYKVSTPRPGVRYYRWIEDLRGTQKMVLKGIVARTRKPATAAALQALFFALAAAWLIGVLAVTVWATLYSQMGENTLYGVQVAAVLVGALGVTLFGTWGELYGQHARDVRALAIYEALKRNETPPHYTVYLRPFASTGEISDVSITSPLAGALGLSLGGEELELEGQMERAVRPLGPLIALGQPLEHIGAGRIFVGEDEWREAIKLLLSKARLIIMLPSARHGTLEEIEMIIDTGLIDRAVMIDPPNVNSSKKFNQPEEWTKVRDAFAKRGFTVPEDSHTGLLLFFGEQREPKFKERLDIDAEDRVERIFRRVIRFRNSNPAQA